jgi:hypothetical protein
MAKRGGGNQGLILLGAAVAGVLLLYLKTGRGENNSPLIPDSIEDPIDRIVYALNQKFGRRWVNLGLDVLQAYIERAMPGVASLVNRVYQAEAAYAQYANAGRAKKQFALRLRAA